MFVSSNFNRISNSSLNLCFFKKILLPTSLKIDFFFFKNQRFLILKKNNTQQFFLSLPVSLNLIFKEKYCYLICTSLINITFKGLYSFFKQLKTCFHELVRFNSVTFLVRGTGLKLGWLNTVFNVLTLKIGYSHTILLPIVKGILATTILKKKIIFCGFNKIVLGNFSSKFYKYRPVNVFTGKGFLIKQKRKIKLKKYVKKV